MKGDGRNMNALVIGAAGFVGHHLIKGLITKGYTVYATKLPFEKSDDMDCIVIDLDIADEVKIKEAILTSHPDVIFNLAALSSVALSWERIEQTFMINVIGVIHLLNSVKAVDKDIRVVLIGSSEEYGYIEDAVMPIGESHQVNPSNPYAISKAAQTNLGSMYAHAFDMNIIMMRAFNHIGPGQPNGFAIASFCEQIVKIERGLCLPVIKTGNLKVKRDFTDVRDIVEGYIACSQLGHTGKIYNIGSGNSIEIEELLHKLLSYSAVKISLETDPNKLRLIDVPIITADIAELTRDTGWKPKIPLDKTISDTLDYWRNKSGE
jgi:GDP-4-dehydro-6-deoxy-D-mannose reductase